MCTRIESNGKNKYPTSHPDTERILGELEERGSRAIVDAEQTTGRADDDGIRHHFRYRRFFIADVFLVLEEQFVDKRGGDGWFLQWSAFYRFVESGARVGVTIDELVGTAPAGEEATK